jgi:hypothetical protein
VCGLVRTESVSWYDVILSYMCMHYAVVASLLMLLLFAVTASVQSKATSKPNELNEAVALAKGQHLQQKTDAKEQKRAGTK